jgi:hypothetical protein
MHANTILKCPTCSQQFIWCKVCFQVVHNLPYFWKKSSTNMNIYSYNRHSEKIIYLIIKNRVATAVWYIGHRVLVIKETVDNAFQTSDLQYASICTINTPK